MTSSHRDRAARQWATHFVGKYFDERERQTGNAVPVFTSSPGDSSVGMNLAALQMEGSRLKIDPLTDVNQSESPVDPDKLPDSVTCYLDSAAALPIMTAYALARKRPRPQKRLMGQAGQCMSALTANYPERGVTP